MHALAANLLLERSPELLGLHAFELPINNPVVGHGKLHWNSARHAVLPVKR